MQDHCWFNLQCRELKLSIPVPSTADSAFWSSRCGFARAQPPKGVSVPPEEQREGWQCLFLPIHLLLAQELFMHSSIPKHLQHSNILDWTDALSHLPRNLVQRVTIWNGTQVHKKVKASIFTKLEHLCKHPWPEGAAFSSHWLNFFPLVATHTLKHTMINLFRISFICLFLAVWAARLTSEVPEDLSCWYLALSVPSWIADCCFQQHLSFASLRLCWKSQSLRILSSRRKCRI